MKRVYFKTGDKVKVTMDGHNASDFILKLDIDIMGVYSLADWREIEFTICGQYEKIKFEFNKKIYGAYLLSIKNKIVGFVYNTALKLLD